MSEDGITGATRRSSQFGETTRPLTEEMLREDIEMIRNMDYGKSSWVGTKIKVKDLKPNKCYMIRRSDGVVGIANSSYLQHEQIGPAVYDVGLETIIEAEEIGLGSVDLVYEGPPKQDYITGVRKMLSKRRKR